MLNVCKTQSRMHSWWFLEEAEVTFVKETTRCGRRPVVYVVRYSVRSSRSFTVIIKQSILLVWHPMISGPRWCGPLHLFSLSRRMNSPPHGPLISATRNSSNKYIRRNVWAMWSLSPCTVFQEVFFAVPIRNTHTHEYPADSLCSHFMYHTANYI